MHKLWRSKLTWLGLGLGLVIFSTALTNEFAEWNIAWLSDVLLWAGIISLIPVMGGGRYKYNKWADYMTRGLAALIIFSWLLAGITWLLKLAGYTFVLPTALGIAVAGAFVICLVSFVLVHMFQRMK